MNVSPEDFGRLFSSFEREAFRLETRDTYTVPEEQDTFRAFLNGEPQPEKHKKGAWVNVIRQNVDAGKRMYRAHIVARPLSDYLRYELSWGYRRNQAAGEEFFILDITDKSNPLEGLTDFWMFDEKTIISLQYNDIGEFLGAEMRHEAGLPIALSMIVTKHNAHEVGEMRSISERLNVPFDEYVNMTPTIYGGAESLPAQSVEHLRKRKPFTGCNAGHTFFHVDPHGMASICKIGRDPQVPLMETSVDGLRQLSGIADGLLLRRGGCTGCTLQGTCGTCMPLVTLYRKARAPLATYYQHRERNEVAG